MSSSPHHLKIRNFFQQTSRAKIAFGITQHTLFELIHVVTDGRRFEKPLPMEEALSLSREIWNSLNVVQLVPRPETYNSMCELMTRFQLGRKRIFDTALAATLESAGIHQLATLNARDYKIFPFLEIVDPLAA